MHSSTLLNFKWNEARVGDLMWAMDENTINGIICMMGGIVRGRIFSGTAGQ